MAIVVTATVHPPDEALRVFLQGAAFQAAFRQVGHRCAPVSSQKERVNALVDLSTTRAAGDVYSRRILGWRLTSSETMSTLPRRFAFRASEEDCELNQQAAAETSLSISDYVRSRTVEDARRNLADRRRIHIGPEHAEAFYAALDDSTPVPELRRLADVAPPTCHSPSCGSSCSPTATRPPNSPAANRR